MHAAYPWMLGVLSFHCPFQCGIVGVGRQPANVNPTSTCSEQDYSLCLDVALSLMLFPEESCSPFIYKQKSSQKAFGDHIQ